LQYEPGYDYRQELRSLNDIILCDRWLCERDLYNVRNGDRGTKGLIYRVCGGCGASGKYSVFYFISYLANNRTTYVYNYLCPVPTTATYFDV